MKKPMKTATSSTSSSKKKFVDSDYKDDKTRIIDKYNELGYRDARIVKDSVVKYDDSKVDVYLEVEEGKNTISATSTGWATPCILPRC